MSEGYKVAGGDRLGKTIIFAKNQAHAAFVQRRFDIGWPEYGGQFARVITYDNRYAQSLIDAFSTKDKAPHIAISVDMLDTGIDVPEVVNLVFFKMVRSKSKFWQMIGRGTRMCADLFGPGADKEDFLVFDFCGNLEFFSQDLPGAEGALQKSLTQRIMESRLELITTLDLDGGAPDLRSSSADLWHEFVAGMTTGNVLVRPHRRAVERFAERAAWESLSREDAEHVLALAGLPSAAKDADEAAKRFDLLILRRQLADLQGDAATAERVRESVQAIAGQLLAKTAIPSVAEQAVLIESVAGDQWWVDVTLSMLELARLRLRSLVQFVERTARKPVYTDFEDTVGDAAFVDLPGVTPGTDFERFRAKAETYLRQHIDHVALQRLHRNKPLTPEDLTSLAEMLRAAGAQDADLARAAEQTGGLGLFIRSLVGLDRQAAQEAFAEYLDEARFTVEQIRFINLIVEELTANGQMEPGRLYESPFTDHAPTGPDFLFPDAVENLVTIIDEVRANAAPAGVA
ncbi:type I restriction-modification enzyme R subunit C-terminal domain-containing protein [Ruania albidiflava]|uniref:type I restriction-modification enzyme R subunit C-terminal domain-containing protein n=1 Tax=Ruania albidiflava TaxID=366586 RepID=UPI001FDF89DE|nr:type I restriction-modification enzyme R subunit C-terminal domain-containing protein [Ruania albidiflava]